MVVNEDKEYCHNELKSYLEIFNQLDVSKKNLRDSGNGVSKVNIKCGECVKEFGIVNKKNQLYGRVGQVFFL